MLDFDVFGVREGSSVPPVVPGRSRTKFAKICFLCTNPFGIHLFIKVRSGSMLKLHYSDNYNYNELLLLRLIFMPTPDTDYDSGSGFYSELLLLLIL